MTANGTPKIFASIEPLIGTSAGDSTAAGGATSDTEPTVAQFRDDEPGGVASGTLGSQLKQEEQSESGARVIWSYSLSVVSLLSLACNYS